GLTIDLPHTLGQCSLRDRIARLYSQIAQADTAGNVCENLFGLGIFLCLFPVISRELGRLGGLTLQLIFGQTGGGSEGVIADTWSCFRQLSGWISPAAH